jgi:hypothetical protein
VHWQRDPVWWTQAINNLKSYSNSDGIVFQASAVKLQGDEALQRNLRSMSRNYYKQAWTMLLGTAQINSGAGVQLVSALYLCLAKVDSEELPALRQKYEQCQSRYGFKQALP